IRRTDEASETHSLLIAAGMYRRCASGQLGRRAASFCPRQHPAQHAISQCVMMVERRSRVADGDDHDRPANPFVELTDPMMGGAAPFGEGDSDLEARNAHRL